MTVMDLAVKKPPLSDVERTARDTTVAQWGVAIIVMAGSTLAGWHMIGHLGESGWIGAITALAVDLGLAQWIRISVRLRALGITSRPGWWFELATMTMTVYLNVGAAIFLFVRPYTWPAIVLLGIAHIFVPVTLVLLIQACGDAQLQLLQVKQAEDDRLAAEQAKEAQRRDRAADAALRTAELEAQRHERELAAARQIRDHENHQLSAVLASQLALGAALRHRPALHRRTPVKPTTKQPRPRAARLRAVDTGRLSRDEITPEQFAELVAEARVIQGRRIGKVTGRGILMKPRSEGGLNVSDPLARQILTELGNPAQLRSIAMGGS